MKCPKCQAINRIENGVIIALQRYKCKDCGCIFMAKRNGALSIPTCQFLLLAISRFPVQKVEFLGNKKRQ
ncbi:MAG: hypothetical protein FWD02_02050 [Bacteroidales bacterium]|nr:hypothetical protein [Bacteroidales bacterium]